MLRKSLEYAEQTNIFLSIESSHINTHIKQNSMKKVRNNKGKHAIRILIYTHTHTHTLAHLAHNREGPGLSPGSGEANGQDS